MMSLWDALRMNMMISYQELVRTFLCVINFALILCPACADTNKLPNHYLVIFPDIPGRPFDYFSARGD